MAVSIAGISKEHGNHEDPHVSSSDLGSIGHSTGKIGRTGRVLMPDWIKQGGRAATDVAASTG